MNVNRRTRSRAQLSGTIPDYLIGNSIEEEIMPDTNPEVSAPAASGKASQP